MAGIFSKPKAEVEPKIDESLRKQEDKNKREDASSRRRLAARASARRTGGSRMLMAPGVFGEAAQGRDVANLSNTLGAGRNPRG